MILLPTSGCRPSSHRSANCKWLYGSAMQMIWIHPSDAQHLGGVGGPAARRDPDRLVHRQVLGHRGIKPGIIAMSHHLGRWRLKDDEGVNRGMSGLAQLDENPYGQHKLRMLKGGSAWQSDDPDTARIWWEDVGVHRTSPCSATRSIAGHHVWLQKAVWVRKARPGERHGDVWVDTKKSMEVYREWKALTKPADRYSPDGTRRPYWLKRPLSEREAYSLRTGPRRNEHGAEQTAPLNRSDLHSDGRSATDHRGRNAHDGRPRGALVHRHGPHGCASVPATPRVMTGDRTVGHRTTAGAAGPFRWSRDPRAGSLRIRATSSDLSEGGPSSGPDSRPVSDAGPATLRLDGRLVLTTPALVHGSGSMSATDPSAAASPSRTCRNPATEIRRLVASLDRAHARTDGPPEATSTGATLDIPPRRIGPPIKHHASGPAGARDA